MQNCAKIGKESGKEKKQKEKKAEPILAFFVYHLLFSRHREEKCK